MQRHQGRIPSVVVAIIVLLGFATFLGQLFAQEPPEDMPAEDEMMMEEGMGMPGGGRAAAGAPLGWTEPEMPEELVMTYAAYLAETGRSRALIPDEYLFDEEGEPKKATKNQWGQIYRIYETRRAVAVAEERVGRPGGPLSDRIAMEMAVKENETRVIRELYEQGLKSFWFEVSYPQISSQDISPGVTAVPVEVGVAMHVKANVAQRYPSLVYRRLKRFDNYGVDRGVFHIVDYEGGMWNPKIIRLWNGSMTLWNQLWGENSIRLVIYDIDGDRIVSGEQPAGLDGAICAKLVYPDELNYTPMHELLIPPKGYTFEGGHLNLDYKKGWYYSFSFTIPVAQLAGLDRAEVMLVGSGGLEGSRSQTQAAPPRTDFSAGGASASAAAAGAEAASDRARNALPAMGLQVPPLVVPF